MRCSNYGAPNVIVKDPQKPRNKTSNAGDAKDVIQEARERQASGKPMNQREYYRRMHEVCRDTPGEKGKELRKAREQDMQYRKEAGY